MPPFIDAFHIARCFQDEGALWLFQEDCDPSQGMRKDGLAKATKDANWITNLKHPAQSPDPKHYGRHLEYIKGTFAPADIQFRMLKGIEEEWDRITLDEIRAHIRCMPGRCERVAKSGGKPIKDAMW